MQQLRRARAPFLTAAISALLLVSTVVSVAADESLRKGVEVLDEWTDTVKTGQGRTRLRFRAVYDWDRGIAYRETYRLSGELLARQTLNGPPSPTPEEIAAARAIVLADTEVGQIARRQGGLQLEGGFAMRQRPGEGPCVLGTRCLQMLLFDGENVVRHMLVDLRAGRILEPDYVPPRNRGTGR